MLIHATQLISWLSNGKDMKPRVFSIADASADFKDYYDNIQEFIKAVAGYDEMLPGESTCIESYYAYNNFLQGC